MEPLLSSLVGALSPKREDAHRHGDHTVNMDDDYRHDAHTVSLDRRLTRHPKYPIHIGAMISL